MPNNLIEVILNRFMSYLITPEGYKPLLDLKQTELGIKQIKEFFQLNLSSELRLRRVTAPLFVLKGMGINDDLSKIWVTPKLKWYTPSPNGNASRLPNIISNQDMASTQT